MMRCAPWALCVGAVGLAALGVALGLIGERQGLRLPPDAQSGLVAEVVALVATLLVGLVGLVLARKVAENPIGWIALAAAAALGVMGLSRGYADLVVYGGKGWPAGAWAAWLASWTVIVPAFVAPCLVAQLFPDGRPQRGRWTPLFRVSIGLGTYLVVAPALQAGPTGAYETVQSPLGTPAWLDALLRDVVWAVAILVLLALSLASVAVRFRRSRGIERQQLTWLALAASIAIGGMLAWFLTYELGSLLGTLFLVVSLLGMGLMPIAIAVAILRYRLYEIDRIVSRTLVYGALSLLLGVVYLGLVLAGQWVFSSFAGGSNLAIALSTLVVAALFLPVRSRVQRFVDRRFYRRRYDAQRTLEGFGARLREQIALETLSSDLALVVQETIQPSHVSLWLRSGR